MVEDSQQYHVRIELAGVNDGGGLVIGGGNDVDVGLLVEQQLEHFPNDADVLDQQQPDRLHEPSRTARKSYFGRYPVINLPADGERWSKVGLWTTGRQSR